MNSPSSCKCLHCRGFFIPCPNSRHTQRYCAKSECRKASKAAAQAKWLNKTQNRSYFRGPENVERVQRWRERHPGYWRKKRSSRPDALQDLAPSEVSQNQPITINEIGLLADDFGLCEPSKPSKTPTCGCVTSVALYLNRRLWPFTALNSWTGGLSIGLNSWKHCTKYSATPDDEAVRPPPG